MAVAHLDQVPGDLLERLQEGDIIFTQRLNSWLSWAVMFFTSSPIDHAAVYIGDGKVIHATATGVKIHSLATVTKGTRVLPVSFAPHETELPFSLPNLDSEGVYSPRFPLSRLPMRWQFAWGAVRIVTGFHPERFRWKFLADMWSLALLVDLLLISLVDLSIAIPAAALCSVVALANLGRWKLGGRYGQFKPISHPDIGYRSFFRIGGIMVSRLGPLVVAEFGILPLNIFLALCREGADHSTPDELQELRQRICNVAERWGFRPPTQEAENGQRNQNDDEEIQKRTNSPRHPNE